MKNYPEFAGIHNGKKALIIALGESANNIRGCDLKNIVTIGVNDVDRVCVPNYVLTVDSPNRFSGARLDAMCNTKAEYFFTQVENWRKIPALTQRVVTFKLGGRRLENVNNTGTLDYSNNSPFVAIILAYQMGCREIGIIGLDFTDNHCYAQDGVHELVRSGRLQEIEKDYGKLTSVLDKNGCKLYNLSDTTKISAIPKMPLKTYVS